MARVRPTAEGIVKEPDPQATSREQKPLEEDDAAQVRRSAPCLDMLFREAEVIARNLKESGTRR